MSKQISVWDPLLRIFHWSLVLSFIIAYLSGDEENTVHIYAGYSILGLISFRLIWGFIGSKYAKFNDFIFSPSTIINYLKNLSSGQAKRYIGHNPAGSAMIIALLLGLILVSYSGLKIYAIEEGAGLLAQRMTQIELIKSAYADDEEHGGEDEDSHHNSNESDEEFWEEIHETSANFILLLVILHIAGVIISGRLHNENLVKAMITGKKKSE